MQRVIVILAFFTGVSVSAGVPDGFGRFTTGGAGGTVVTVDNADDFIYYVQGTKQTPYVVYVDGHINLGSSNIRVRGNKTVIGLPGSRITGNLKCYRPEESNNIFRYLNMDNAAKAGDGDCISIDGVTNIWIDHCTFTDAGDGAVDIKGGADYVTVSWCKFQYTANYGHSYVNLIGHSDTNGATDMGRLHVTFHHNWYSNLCHERMPSVRFGRAHIYNTYFDSPNNRYCIRTRLYAECLVENNYFKDVQNPWERYTTSAGGDPGLLYASGNIFDNVTWYVNYDSNSSLIPGTDTVFTPPYAYALDPASMVPAIVQWGAGADGRDGYPPHWMYGGTYGDFDRSGRVDLEDFGQFAGYWQATEDIENADYDEDGIVDEYELLLFVDNWMRDVIPPAAPDGLSALGQDGQVLLSWAENTEADLNGYFVYRAAAVNGDYVRLNDQPVPTAEYMDTDVVNGTVYYYAVSAVDFSGNESGASNTASALPDVIRPAAPEALWGLGQDGQVTLNWAENSEADLDGYFVYRTTTWGANYARLNDVPVPTAVYADNNVVNGTMYYYRVSAVNLGGNESDASIWACAAPAAGPANLTLQEDALGFCSVQGIVDYGKHTGFTGAGFLDATNSSGTGINWKVNIGQAGTYTLRWRYANNSDDRPGRLLVNGTQVIASISFPGTTAWNIWSDVSVEHTFSAGPNTIRLEGILGESLANIDYLKLIGSAPEASVCP